MRRLSPCIFDFDLFERISNSKSRIPSESKREAWIADTILLLASELGKSAVLSGGSAVRNITRIMRTTYDIDFDTEISSLSQIKRTLSQVNRRLNIKGKEPIGSLHENPERDNIRTFYGSRKMLHMLRRTDTGYIKVHIMYVPEMPEMFKIPNRLELVSIEPTDRTVPTARAEHLFFRKTVRANTERRVEDFIDTYYILRSLGTSGRSTLISYAKSKDADAASRGLKILADSPESFIPELSVRLSYVESDLSMTRLRELAYSISQELARASEEVVS